MKESRGAAEAGEGLCPCWRVLHSEPFITSHEGHTCASYFKVILPTAHRLQPQTIFMFRLSVVHFALGFHRGFLRPNPSSIGIGEGPQRSC